MNRAIGGCLILIGLLAAVGCVPSPEDGPPGWTAPNGAARQRGGPSGGQTAAGIDPAQPLIEQSVDDAASVDELLLFFPSKHPEGNWQPEGLEFEDVWFNAADGTRLHGWYCPCESPRAYVLFAHGNAGNLATQASLLDYLHDSMHVAVLAFDYRGYGRSEGRPSVEGALDDARAARTTLAKKAGIKESDVVLMGRSLGGAVVVRLAGELAPRGLVLESTFSSLKDVAAHHYPSLARLVPEDKLDSAAWIARYKGPLLQSHGTADRTVPFELGKKLFEAAQEPKTFITITGGGHNSLQSEEYYKALDRFLAELSGKAEKKKP